MGFWLLDRIWSTIDTTQVYVPPPKPEWLTQSDTSGVMEAAYSVLKDALKEQEDRLKVVDSKLQSICSSAPIILTIVFGIIAFLTGERATNFGPRGLLIIEIGGCYVGLQFLRALFAAINGLSVRGFSSIFFDSAPPQPSETKDGYLFRICRELSSAIHKNNEVIDGKADQLMVAHDSIKNAVWGLIIVLSIILGITIDKTHYYGIGAIAGGIAVLVVVVVGFIKSQSSQSD